MNGSENLALSSKDIAPTLVAARTALPPEGLIFLGTARRNIALCVPGYGTAPGARHDFRYSVASLSRSAGPTPSAVCRY